MFFRTFLVVVALVILGYTSVVIADHGLRLLPIFFGDMRAMTWPGQFNLDFMFMLTFSGLWVAWRHQFSGGGLVLALCAVFFGSMFLSIYLLILSVRARGDVKAILLGSSRRADG